MFGGHPATVDREGGTTRGAGGDRTLVIDSAAEDVIFRELDALHKQGHEFTAISEERGMVTFGDGSSELRVVIDPIDGSLNAKRLIPSYSLSIAVATGNTMEDVEVRHTSTTSERARSSSPCETGAPR